MQNIFPLKKIGKKGAMSNTNKIIFFGVIALVVIGGLFLYGDNIKASFGGGKLVAEETTTKTITETGEQVAVQAGVSCPSDSTSNGRSRYLDSSSTNKDKVANIIVYAMPVNRPGKSRATLSNTSATGDGYGSAVDLSCDADVPVVYEPIAVTKKFGAVSGFGFTSVVHPQIVAKGDAVDLTFEGKRQDWIRVRVDDLQQRASTAALNNTNASQIAAGSTFNFYPINIEDGSISGSPTRTGVSFRENDGTTFTIAANDFLDLAVKVKTNNTQSVFGENGLRVLVAIEAPAADWQDPVVSGLGITKVDKGSLLGDDSNMLADFEHIYSINQITETEQTLGFYLKTESGVNPSSDPCILFVPEGRYNSVELTDQVRIGAFDDSSSNLQVAFDQAQKLCINVD